MCEIMPHWAYLMHHVQSIIHQSKMRPSFSHSNAPYMYAHFCVCLCACACVCVCVNHAALRAYDTVWNHDWEALQNLKAQCCPGAGCVCVSPR